MPSRRAEREAGPGMLRQQWGFRQVSEYSFRFWVGEGMCLKRLLISFVYLTCWLQRKSLSIKFEFIFLSPKFLSVAFPRAKVYLTGEQPEQKLFSSQVSRRWQPIGMGAFHHRNTCRFTLQTSKQLLVVQLEAFFSMEKNSENGVSHFCISDFIRSSQQPCGLLTCFLNN